MSKRFSFTFHQFMPWYYIRKRQLQANSIACISGELKIIAVFQNGLSPLSISEGYKKLNFTHDASTKTVTTSHSFELGQCGAHAFVFVKIFCTLCPVETKGELKGFSKTPIAGKLQRGAYREQWVFWQKAALLRVFCSRPCQGRQFQTHWRIFTTDPKIFH